MTAATDRSATPRTYGNWYKARGFGIGQLGAGQTITLFLALLVPIAVAYVSGRAALVAGGAALVVIAATVIRIDGQSFHGRGGAAGAVHPGPRGGLDRAVGRHPGRPSPRPRPARADGPPGGAVGR